MTQFHFSKYSSGIFYLAFTSFIIYHRHETAWILYEWLSSTKLPQIQYFIIYTTSQILEFVISLILPLLVSFLFS